jgi:hypothetical protein
VVAIRSGVFLRKGKLFISFSSLFK